MALDELKTRAKRAIKEVLGRNNFFEQEMFTVYPYMFEPDQLMFIANTAVEQLSVAGSYIEVGCARGASTAFVNRALAQHGAPPRYITLDTFAGFPAEQSDYEIRERGKPEDIKVNFVVNRQEWVERSLRLAGVRHVECITGDAAVFDYSAAAPISWCLLDVDLYLPMKAALPRIYEALAPGGVIIVDDCMDDERWDGALQAFREFTDERGLPPTIVHRKLGVIRK